MSAASLREAPVAGCCHNFLSFLSLSPLKDQFFHVWLEVFSFHWQLAENLYAFMHGKIDLL
jgi:hypothetical protein